MGNRNKGVTDAHLSETSRPVRSRADRCRIRLGRTAFRHRGTGRRPCGRARAAARGAQARRACGAGPRGRRACAYEHGQTWQGRQWSHHPGGAPRQGHGCGRLDFQGLRHEADSLVMDRFALHRHAARKAPAEAGAREMPRDRHPGGHLPAPFRGILASFPRRHRATDASFHRRRRLPAHLALAERTRTLVATPGVSLRHRRTRGRHP